MKRVTLTIALAALFAASFGRAPAEAPKIDIPPGFTSEVVCDGIDGAVTMDLARDGRVFICEQTGAIRVVKDGTLLAEPFVKLEVDDFWERGVIGVALHPDFPERPFVYVHYVSPRPHPHHVVSRFTAEGDRAKAGIERVMIEGGNQNAEPFRVRGGHQGGAMRFGADGKLYVTIGEHTTGAPAQRLDSLLGKLLRLNLDGSIPGDNPFLEKTANACRAIYAIGLRNPFGLAVQSDTGRIMIMDVGQEMFEEIDEAKPGANYGWPKSEGPAGAADGITKPIHFYDRRVGTCISGGVFYPQDATQFPPRYRGKLFFADFMAAWIRVLDPDRPEKSEPFALRIPSPTDLAVERDGSLLVLARNAWVRDDKYKPNQSFLLRIRCIGEK